MTHEEALYRVKGYLTDVIPAEDYSEVEEIIEALEQQPCIQEKQANADKIDAVYIDGFKAGYSQAKFDLEQEPCDDAVSRKDAEQMFRNIRCHLKPQDYKSAEEFNTRDLMLLNAEQMIHALPSVMHKSGKWIPVSERLPEYNGWYQCTANLDDLLLTVDLYYKNGKWLDNRRINMFDTYEIYGYGNSTEKHKLSYEELISEFDWTANVIAWMPLPEPYEPQERSDKCSKCEYYINPDYTRCKECGAERSDKE